MTTDALDAEKTEMVTEPGDSDLEELQASLRGTILRPGDEGYEGERQI